MSSALWVSLSGQCSLEEIQAGLQVVVALLCTAGIFTFTRLCWQSSSNRLRKNEDVNLSALLSIKTIGEAFDVISLLQWRLFSQRYWKLLAQAVVVTVLTVGTIVSGPIAKASTRTTSGISLIDTPGHLAKVGFGGQNYAVMHCADTIRELDRAGFPHDQLLDFMPQQNSTWVYRPKDWNSTWSMSCNKTHDTALNAVEDTGDCGRLSAELPITKSFFDYKEYQQHGRTWHSWRTNDTGTASHDALVFLAGWRKYENNPDSMSFDIATMHIRGLPHREEPACVLGPGSAESASFSKIACTLTKQNAAISDQYRAYPDYKNQSDMPEALKIYFMYRKQQEAWGNQTITAISPKELIRFYQAYTITKDIQHPYPVQRSMTTSVTIVQISSAFIALACFCALMTITGLLIHTCFSYRYKDIVRDIPESKLDWIIQSILDEAELQQHNAEDFVKRSLGLSLREKVRHNPAQVRAVFESAQYGQSKPEQVWAENRFSPQPPSYTDGPRARSPGLESQSISESAISPLSTNSFANSFPCNSESRPPMTTTSNVPAAQLAVDGLSRTVSGAPRPFRGYAVSPYSDYYTNPHEASFDASRSEVGNAYRVQVPRKPSTLGGKNSYQIIT